MKISKPHWGYLNGSKGKVLATKHDDLSSGPGIYMVKEQNLLPQVVLWPHMHHRTIVHTHTILRKKYVTLLQYLEKTKNKMGEAYNTI